MYEDHVNSIVGVTDARDKLQKAMVKKYPTTSDSRFEIGIDPFSGKYTIVIFLSDPSIFKRIPPFVKGYRVFDGFKPFAPEEGTENA